MPLPKHTYGPKCRLAPVQQLPPLDDDDIPPITAQFFYSSVLPIDDPLASGTIAATPDARSSKATWRSFSHGDNNTLEKTWLGLASEDERKGHQLTRRNQSPDPSLARKNLKRRVLMVKRLARRHWEKHGEGYRSHDVALPPAAEASSSTPVLVCCVELYMDASTELRSSICALARKDNYSLTTENVVQETMMELRRLKSAAAAAASSTPQESAGTELEPKPEPAASSSAGADATATSSRSRGRMSVGKVEAASSKSKVDSCSQTAEQPPPSLKSVEHAPLRPPVLDDGISGMPFVRVKAPGSPKIAVKRAPPEAKAIPTLPAGEVGHMSEALDWFGNDDSSGAAEEINDSDTGQDGGNCTETAVGVSRLHMVTFPALQMKPIYWSPLNDVAVVMRATWFYRDTMMPVDPVVANQLEAGYRELRPYSLTWEDEIRCAVEVGPLGEEKVSHQLWGSESGQRSWDKDGLTDAATSFDPYCAAHCFRGEAAAVGVIEPVHVPGSQASPASERRSYSNYDVIYKDKNTAFLLKPSLKPSAYYSRRPVAKIVKGITVGIPVVRGFDRRVWEQIYGKTGPAKTQAPTSATTTSHESTGQDVCPACKAENERNQVTDLVLVVHGIGQKFAERVESFHFTHAINSFRRAVNKELDGDMVKSILRDGQNGIMVLPVNWRHTLSFVDNAPEAGGDPAAHAARSFNLKDIEPGTIPAVRSLISDIMFDVPFYMSHHKAKMIEGLVAEANRVYRLWCHNNPGFARNGRVHLIGHSLGSAMALEVLSRQPNRVPELDLASKLAQTGMFEFDTTNLFLAGSPAGFFLLLERGILVPRRGRHKPGAEAADVAAEEVTGQAGRFGCLAIDNIYNILAKEDPIAYLLNGTIDPSYAASLKVAYVPSISMSIFKTVSDAMKSMVPGVSPAAESFGSAPTKPATVRLPSQLELEVHDFTREEIAERKAYLLNDNGQLDYFLRSGGGPMEIQYLNMLSAHSSYWTNQDFIRLICIEVGRRPGRGHTLPAMRAVKAAKRVLPGLG